MYNINEWIKKIDVEIVIFPSQTNKLIIIILVLLVLLLVLLVLY